MNYCRQVKPSSMADLIAMTALFRPGPMDINAHQDFADIKSGKIKEIRETLGMETNEFNPYRKRLIRKGIVSGETRGYVYFTLPLFDEYVVANY